jgi:hypothetical protein
MKTKIVLLLSIFIILSCNKNTKSNFDNKNLKAAISKNENSLVALQFINDYCKLCKSQYTTDKTISVKSWIANNSLLSKNFKINYKNLIENAEKNDPELGLGFDPILDAQDFPDAGFELNATENNNYLTMKAIGKEWENFTIKMKVIKSANQYLVDGCGVINIPESKREKR